MCSSDIVRDTTVDVKRTQRTVTLEEALACTKFGKFNYLITIISGIILSTVLLETLGISYVITNATCDLLLTTQERGTLSAIAFAGIISSSHLWGFLADTKGRRKIIFPALFITSVCSVLSSLSNNFYMLVILRYLCGFFVSAGSATIYAYLGEFHDAKTRTRSVMGASIVFGFGCMALPLLALMCLNQEWQFYVPVFDILYKPWRFFLVVCTLPSVLCAFALYKLPESPKYKYSKGHHDVTIMILRKVYAFNTGKDPETFPVTQIVDESETVKKRKDCEIDENNNNSTDDTSNGKSILKLFRKIIDQTFPLFKPPYLNRTLIACILQFGIFVTSNGMYMIFPDILNRVAEYSNKMNGTDDKTLCEIVELTTFDVSVLESNGTATVEQCNQKLDFSTFKNSMMLEVLYAVGFSIIGALINKVGKLPILLFVFVGCGAAGIASAFTGVQYAIIYYVILLWCGLTIAVVNAATVDLYPTNLRAMAICLSLMSGRAGSVIGSYVVGIFIETSCSATFIGSGTSLIACGVLSFFIPNIMKRKEKSFAEKDAESGNNVEVA
ncbi:synaptic vesicle glycoprotein 2B-like [Culicoides brevitarsis]|uniref:synaptic vesicle glycoprotein 2B-like n=1 Tax=Culicoides brevitarsis TaxID=469753 RepID=UPI00307C2D12